MSDKAKVVADGVGFAEDDKRRKAEAWVDALLAAARARREALSPAEKFDEVFNMFAED